jgi:hypothetical protein
MSRKNQYFDESDYEWDDLYLDERDKRKEHRRNERRKKEHRRDEYWEDRI